MIYNNPRESPLTAFKPHQRAKKVVSDSPGLFLPLELVIFVPNLPGQVLFLGEIQITEGLYQKGFWG